MIFNITKFIPTKCFKNVYQIDYVELFKEGKRLILMDVDNTLIPYDQIEINEKIKTLFEEIKAVGLDIVLISNNKKRIVAFLNGYYIPYVYKATKPFKRGFKKAMKINYNEYKKEEVIVIGDQIITDVLGARRIGIDVILVKPIKKHSEKWYTKILRYFEKKALCKIKKSNIEKYNRIIEIVGEYN